jgi:hypothetical protein
MLFPPSSTSKQNNELPQEYVIKKFFDLGYFAQYNQGNNNYSCSCPICREGDTGIGKVKRCFYLPDKNLIYCHRCGWSSRPLKWIKEVSGMTSYEIFDEIRSNDYDYLDLGGGYFENKVKDIIEEIVPEDDSLPKDPIDLCDPQQIGYYRNNLVVKTCLHYLINRNLYKAINRPKSWFTSLKDKIHYGRLIIPYYDEKQKIAYYQSRDVTGASNIRYLSKLNGVKSVFNLGNLDYNKENYYIFEGPFDSCFVKNGLAIGGITTSRTLFSGIQEEQLDKILLLNRIWVLDSQYQDEAAREKSRILLEENEQVFLWPKEYGEKYKDFNDIAIAKKLNEISESFILENTVSGISGLIKLAQIK